MAGIQRMKFSRDLAKFTDRQKEAAAHLDSGQVKFLLYGGALGGGKALALDTPISTPDGWVNMGDIRPGDIVFDENGERCNVIALSEIIYEPTYRVTFSDGSSIVAGERHQWVTSTRSERARIARGSDEWRAKRRAKRKSRATGNKSLAFTAAITARNKINRPPIQDIPTSSIRTTREIADTVGLRHSVDVAKALVLPDRDLLVEPYVLGAWLGDGTSSSGDITGIDEEIFDQVANSDYTVTMRTHFKTRGVLGLKVQLREIGVLNNKHIPNEYLRASKAQRLALLQGIMDTDGSCDVDGDCEITLTNKRLAEDVRELVLSLGSKCTIRESDAKLNGRYISPRYRIGFLMADPAFRLSRKSIRQKRSGFRGTHDRRYIISVEPVLSVPLRCIQVDSPSHMYLCGREMIPTHNSYFLRWNAVRRLLVLRQRFGITGANVMLACEDYPSLKDRQLSKIGREFPPWLGTMHTDHKEHGRCFVLAPRYGSGVICFRNLDDPSKYQSSEFAMIEVDELTKNDFETFTHLRSRLRWPGLPDIECQFVGATNPGGIGHGWVKQFWMDKDFPPEWISPIDHRQHFAYVPSKATDNPHLDPAYWATLSTLPENLRKAFRDGDWNIFVGQAFPEVNREVHGIKPVWPIPRNAPLYSTFDWGFGKPFSWCWWGVDNDGRVILFAEWYGWNGTPNEGLRLSDTDVALGIIEREKQMGIWGRSIIRLAGPDCFQKRPDYRGGGQGPSTAEVFAQNGLFLSVGDPSRELKIRAFRERLRRQDDGKPMLLVYNTCEHFFRTIPNLIMDEHKPEDIDSSGEDHEFDSVCHICMARPLPASKPKRPNPWTDTRLDELYSGRTGDEFEDYMRNQQRQTIIMDPILG